MNFIRFGGIYAALSLLVPAVLWGLEWATGAVVPATALWVVPVMGAAMFEGQYFARAMNRVPTKGECWGFARKAALVVLAVSLLLVILVGLVIDGEVFDIFLSLLSDQTGLLILCAVTVFLLLLAIPVSRYFFGMGATSEMKALAKRAGT